MTPLEEAIELAHGLANITGAPAYVVRHENGYVFLASPEDLRIYHRRDIARHDAHIAFIAYPMPPAFGWPDHEGWGAVPYGALAA